MIRQSRVKIQFANAKKLNILNELTEEMRKVVNLYINDIWKNNDFKSKFVDFKVETKLSARMQQCLGKIALQNVKSQRKKRKKTCPVFTQKSFDLDYRFFDIEYHNNSFDIFLRLKSMQSKTFIKLPLNKHKHFNKLISMGFQLKNSIRLLNKNNEYYIDFIFEKNDTKKKDNGDIIGCDIGYKKLITLSNKQVLGTDDMRLIYEKISRKKQASNSFKKALRHRDNKINELLNKINFSDIKEFIVEDLKQVKYKKSGILSRQTNNKLARWTYPKVLDKLSSICDYHGVLLTKVNPKYTSQKCSCCGLVDKNSRKLQEFQCTSCGYKIDADYNASINISQMGVYSPHSLSDIL